MYHIHMCEFAHWQWKEKKDKNLKIGNWPLSCADDIKREAKRGAKIEY